MNTTCQQCAKACSIWEEVNIKQIGTELEIWCYCPECDIETFSSN